MTDSIVTNTKEELVPGARPPLPHNPASPIPIETEVAAAQPHQVSHETTEPSEIKVSVPDVAKAQENIGPKTEVPTQETSASIVSETKPVVAPASMPTPEITKVEHSIEETPEIPPDSLISEEEVKGLVSGNPKVLEVLAGKTSPAQGASELVKKFQDVRQEHHNDNPINPLTDEGEESIPVNNTTLPNPATEEAPPTSPQGETTEDNPNSNQQ